MPVIIRTFSGAEYTLDRKYTTEGVAKAIQEARHGANTLITFQDDRTPSRSVYVDVTQVESIRHDGYNF